MYSDAELAAIDAVKDDLDLSIWVRDYAKAGSEVPLDTAIATVHQKHHGGIVQWWQENKF